MLQWWADLVDEQTEEGRRVIIGRFAKARPESPVIEPEEEPKPVEPASVSNGWRLIERTGRAGISSY